MKRGSETSISAAAIVFGLTAAACATPDEAPVAVEPEPALASTPTPNVATATEAEEHVPPGAPSAPRAETCRSLADGRSGASVRSRRLQRYGSDRYVVSDDLWDQVSVRRVRDRLRVRWWLPDRDCTLDTEVARADDVVILQERRPTDRCLVVAATIVQTMIALRDSDRRVCLPGQDSPISLDDLEGWSAPLTAPPPRATGGTELVDPFAY